MGIEPSLARQKLAQLAAQRQSSGLGDFYPPAVGAPAGASVPLGQKTQATSAISPHRRGGVGIDFSPGGFSQTAEAVGRIFQRNPELSPDRYELPSTKGVPSAPVASNMREVRPDPIERSVTKDLSDSAREESRAATVKTQKESGGPGDYRDAREASRAGIVNETPTVGRNAGGLTTFPGQAELDAAGATPQKIKNAGGFMGWFKGLDPAEKRRLGTALMHAGGAMAGSRNIFQGLARGMSAGAGAYRQMEQEDAQAAEKASASKAAAEQDRMKRERDKRKEQRAIESHEMNIQKARADMKIAEKRERRLSAEANDAVSKTSGVSELASKNKVAGHIMTFRKLMEEQLGGIENPTEEQIAAAKAGAKKEFEYFLQSSRTAQQNPFAGLLDDPQAAARAGIQQDIQAFQQGM